MAFAAVFVSGGAAVLPAGDFTDITASAMETTENISTGFLANDLPDGTIVITKYLGNEETVIIPETLFNKKVSVIGEAAFLFNHNVKKISVPDTVTTIEKDAFRTCDNLEEVHLGSNVQVLEDLVFFDDEKLKTVNIPSSLLYVGKSCFSHTGLTSVSFPMDVCVIDQNAFNECTALQSAVLPSKLDNINDLVFYGCSSLKSITIPNTVCAIHMGAFRGCSALKNLNIPASVQGIEAYAVGYDIDCNYKTGVTLSVVAGTAGEKYAKENGINYVYGSGGSSNKGDVNGDGKVNAGDITKVAAHIKGLKKLSAAEQERADANSDGNVNAADITKIAAHIKGLKTLS